MTRRSPEVVDGALGFQHHGSPRDASYVWEALDILADEVRALREELALAQPVFSRRQLEATIARVEALPKYWRETSLDRSRTWECAEDVERALKGDP